VFAMWVSTEFYLTVARAFVTMRNDAMQSARISALALAETDKLLAGDMPKATALMLKAKAHGTHGRAAQVDRPLLAKRYLISQLKFQKVFDHEKGADIISADSQSISPGLFKRHTGVFGKGNGWKVSGKGVVWLAGKAKEINGAVRVHQAATKKQLRATKQQVASSSELRMSNSAQ